MIPQLTEQEALSPVVLSFVEALKQSDFTGDVDTHYGGRLIASTDNSSIRSRRRRSCFRALKQMSGRFYR